ADAIDRMGGIDVGWNNAGIMGVSSPLQDLGWSDYRALMEVNLDAVFRGSQRFAQAMIRQGTPALILNTGSENSLFHGVPGGGAYVATKAAVRALTRSLDEDTPRHIQAQLICPGFVHTQLGPDEQFRHGMHADRFADIAFPQIGADRFFILTHGYNAVRVREETDRLLGEFETSGAASAEDTARYDVRSIYESLT
ncbi:MAG: SDR family NAD(P)-dependent oxidoreductase, partial [Pseudomonadota bacterium]